MSKKFLKPAVVLAAALSSLTATIAHSNVEETALDKRLNKLENIIYSDNPLSKNLSIIERPGLSAESETYAYHHSHRSHSSHSSHRSHSSHSSHFSSVY